MVCGKKALGWMWALHSKREREGLGEGEHEGEREGEGKGSHDSEGAQRDKAKWWVISRRHATHRGNG
jgi:hypothetical protein